MAFFLYFAIMNEATKRYIEEHLSDDVRLLALKSAAADVDKSFALRQIEARQLLLKKVPSWSCNDALLFPAHLSVEQCSSEWTALYKANLVQGDSLIDLTGGLGIDCYFLSQKFKMTDYVEHQMSLCEIAQSNFQVLKASIAVHQADSSEYLSSCKQVSCIFIDPARRDAQGQKMVSISDCTPNVIQMLPRLLEKTPHILIKLSPMLDISLSLCELTCVKEVHTVAVNNECKELLFLLERDFKDEPMFFCVNLKSDQPIERFKLSEEKELPLHCAKEVGKYLYEPNVAIMKAGFFKGLSQKYEVLPLHKNSHLYTSDVLIKDFPGRVFEVDGWALYKKDIRKNLLKDVAKASIAVRNFPLSVAELRKTLKITDGDSVYLFATTISDDRKVIIKCLKQ